MQDMAQTSDRNIYDKLAEYAARIFARLSNLEPRAYSASELALFVKRDQYGSYACKKPDALQFRNALENCGISMGDPDNEAVIADGSFECLVNWLSVWGPLAAFEKLACVPKAERVAFTAKSKAEVIYRVRVELPADAALAKKYAADKRSYYDPRFRLAHIDIANGWLWATDTRMMYGGRCKAEALQGAERMLAAPLELVAKHAGQTVEIAYYDDGAIECEGESWALDSSGHFKSKCSFIKAVTKVNTETKIKLDSKGLAALKKFVKPVSDLDIVILSAEDGWLTVMVQDNDRKDITANGSFMLEQVSKHAARVALTAKQFKLLLGDCNGEIWFNGKSRQVIFEAKSEGSFMLCMPQTIERLSEFNDTFETTQDYITLKTETTMAKKIVETPMMKKYAEMKAKHPDAILLFRVGDFYEIFGDDAVECADILGITLTRRANGKDEYIQLAGFPHHALDTYLPKLVRAGKRVAICEELEDPKPNVTREPEPEPVVVPEPAVTAEPEPIPEPEPVPVKEPALKSELRECALAQLPQGAEIVAAKYMPIGDDNGKWQLILKIDDEYRYADIVGAARYLYVCGRSFGEAGELAQLMGMELAAPKAPETPVPSEPAPSEPAGDVVGEMRRMFIEDYGMDWSDADSCAKANVELARQLAEYKSVEFKFRKKDGSERVAHGTLHPDVIPEIKSDPAKPKREPNPKFQTYYDLDKEQWRCFEKANLIISIANL